MQAKYDFKTHLKHKLSLHHIQNSLLNKVHLINWNMNQMNWMWNWHLQVEGNLKNVEPLHFEINSDGGFVIIIECAVAKPVNTAEISCWVHG